ncbi:MAG: DNA-processing protein DprA [bacterium]|nr:DNA-processing protein DprA [bacterium]
MTDGEKIALLNLLGVAGLGSGLAIRLVREFGQPSRVYEAGDGALRTVPRLGERVIEGIRKTKSDASGGVQQFEAARAAGAQVIGYWDDEFPPLLKELEQDSPAVLFVRGKLAPSAKRVAFVGTRRASDYGKRMCRELIGAGRFGRACCERLGEWDRRRGPSGSTREEPDHGSCVWLRDRHYLS